jgi:hypothetical protein
LIEQKISQTKEVTSAAETSVSAESAWAARSMVCVLTETEKNKEQEESNRRRPVPKSEQAGTSRTDEWARTQNDSDAGGTHRHKKRTRCQNEEQMETGSHPEPNETNARDREHRADEPGREGSGGQHQNQLRRNQQRLKQNWRRTKTRSARTLDNEKSSSSTNQHHQNWKWGTLRLVERLGLLRREDTRRQLMGSEAGARPINTEHGKTNGQISRREEIKTVARSAPGAEKERTGGIRRDEWNAETSATNKIGRWRQLRPENENETSDLETSRPHNENEQHKPRRENKFLIEI